MSTLDAIKRLVGVRKTYGKDGQDGQEIFTLTDASGAEVTATKEQAVAVMADRWKPLHEGVPDAKAVAARVPKPHRFGDVVRFEDEDLPPRPMT